MPFFEDRSRGELRQMYIDAWQRHVQKLPLEPLQAQIVAIIELHPEYHALLADPEATLKDFPPELGETNPFLHLAMHMAVRDQTSTDRPAGIQRALESIARLVGSRHDAEHAVMECLAESIWESQRHGLPPNEHQYMACVRRRARGKR